MLRFAVFGPEILGRKMKNDGRKMKDGLVRFLMDENSLTDGRGDLSRKRPKPHFTEVF